MVGTWSMLTWTELIAYWFLLSKALAASSFCPWGLVISFIRSLQKLQPPYPAFLLLAGVGSLSAKRQADSHWEHAKRVRVSQVIRAVSIYERRECAPRGPAATPPFQEAESSLLPFFFLTCCVLWPKEHSLAFQCF